MIFNRVCRLFALLSLLLFVSCNVGINLGVAEDFSCAVSLKTDCEKDAEEEIKAALTAGGATTIFDAVAIEKMLSAAKKTNVSVKNDSLCALNVGFATDSFAKILPINTSIISVSEDKKLLEISLNKKTARECLSLLPDDSLDIVDLLLAPIFGADIVDEAEYIENISLVYGKKIGLALQKSKISVNLEMPKKIIGAKCERKGFATVKTAKNAVSIAIPLTKFLCLNDEAHFLILME